MARVPLIGGKEGAWEVGKKIKKGVDSTYFCFSSLTPLLGPERYNFSFFMGIWGVGMFYSLYVYSYMYIRSERKKNFVQNSPDRWKAREEDLSRVSRRVSHRERMVSMISEL